MKRILASIISIVMLAGAFGCSGRQTVPGDRSAEAPVEIMTPVPEPTAINWPAETDAPRDTETPTEDPAHETEGTPIAVPTAAPTAIPTYEPYIPRNAEDATERFEGYPIEGFVPSDRSDVREPNPIEEPRYVLGEDGIYYNPGSANDSEAVIMLTGDLMCQSRQQLTCRAGDTYNFRGEFEFIRDLFSKADFLVGNLEASISPSAPYMSEQSYVDGSPHLNCPITFLDAIRYAGYDAVVMSNNHNCDLGVRGIYDTLDRVDKYKLLHTGLFRNSEETRYLIVNIDGIKVGFLSYTTYFNHKEQHLSNEGREALLNFYSPERVERDVKAVRAGGAEYVIVYMHWGVEYSNDPTDIDYIKVTENISGRKFTLKVPLDQQLERAQVVADSGADYIVGSHPHAVQPYDVLTASDGRKVPIVYALGNVVSHQKKDVSKDTIILRIILTRDANGNVVLSKEGYVPARMLVSYKGYYYTLVPLTQPYRKDNYDSEFYPAYKRIIAAVGRKLSVMGSY